ncbi:WXG100 family type VII secretion target [Bacillus changyiensis]|uniref:WXG100 family type VII secretion target n=1 Tax=Bacillus changyiensis TaxID=3004103 RepID=UPI0022E27931|nr:WXG100 family type VII secretion target [Bacillus changyiensis]MDA1476856.1 WXG100 family type VII secretion target [Bacillus changyiensis]
MDSNRVIALAQEYKSAADEVKKSELHLLNRLSANAASWKGKTREQFDSDFEQSRSAYQQFEADLIEISNELMKAATKIEQTKAEILRIEKLEEEKKR